MIGHRTPGVREKKITKSRTRTHLECPSGEVYAWCRGGGLPGTSTTALVDADWPAEFATS